jgi:phosphopantetheinyl transferase
MIRDPERHLTATIMPGGVAVVDERWPDAASRELIARRNLRAAERAQYETLNPNAQRAWLLGRIAAKDAVRAALWAEGHGDLFPAEVAIANDERGAPAVTDGPGQQIPVSIAHRDSLGVALAGVRGGSSVGVDVERIAPRGDAAVAAICSPAERALLTATFPDVDDDELITRAWAVKEASAKAAGTGLQGRPKDLSISAADGERLCVAGRWVTSTVVDSPVQPQWDPAIPPPPPTTTSSESRRYVFAWTDSSRADAS